MYLNYSGPGHKHPKQCKKRHIFYNDYDRLKHICNYISVRQGETIKKFQEDLDAVMSDIGEMHITLENFLSKLRSLQGARSIDEDVRDVIGTASTIEMKD
ncbi:hypothetical protein CHS0354_037209 [Potamilus streckersoni]|uniref:Uncharacterized protein n=1 Tax=Potamilus streckersoni TaxID=2493646 RepID=A0AAE0SX70_9BIVA|nr:hypothetical protein CHS0354_037209 [Potamilus streckersoni]